MDQREQDKHFARGMRRFNSCEFWHAHESWEAIWLVAPQPDKTFLQGIIQIAAAFYHHQRSNLEGMRSLMRRGLAKVEEFPPAYRGLRLEELRGAVRAWLSASEDALPRIYPKLKRARPGITSTNSRRR